jgi:hypothetical protein
MDWQTFLQSLAAFLPPFFGVLLAFFLQRVWSWIENRRAKKKLKENIESELKKCLPLLSGKSNLLPTMMWNSTITSGDVKLLSFSDRNKLSTVYSEIENYNYEAKRVRDNAVIAQVGDSKSRVDGMTPPMAHWVRSSKALLEVEESLKKRISELLEEPMWKN